MAKHDVTLRLTTVRRWLIDALIVSTIAACILLVLELGLRVAYPEKIEEYRKDQRRAQELAYVFHPDYLLTLKPLTRKTFRRPSQMGGGEVIWQTNSAGYRGPELRNADLRVVVYGDSNIHARFSELTSTFPYQLERELSRAGGLDVEVINAGVIGFGPDQALLRYASEVNRISPDIVVMHFYADNDLGDVVRNRLFEIDDQQALQRTAFPASVDVELKPKVPRLLLTRAVEKASRSLRGSTAFELSPEESLGAGVDLLRSLNDAAYTVYETGEPRTFSHFQDYYDVDVALFPDSESARTKVRLLNGIMRALEELAVEKGTEVVVLIQPSSRDLTRNISPNYTDFRAYPDYRRDRLSSVVEEAALRHGLHTINLFVPFSTNRPENLYFKEIDDHWNDAGQRLAARITADYIRDQILHRARERNGE